MGEHGPRVRIIQHVAIEGPGRLGEALLEAGLDVVLTRVDRGDEVPPTLFDEDALVILGGPMSATQHGELKHLRREMALLELALMADKPVLGICLGSQLLATMLGAEVRAAPQRELGYLDVTLTPQARGDLLLEGLPEHIQPLCWHGDAFDLPFGAEPLASSALTAHQAFRKGSAWGLLFHLEARAPQVEAMAKAFDSELRDAKVDAETLVRHAQEREAGLDLLGRQVFGRFADAVLRVAGGGHAVAHDEGAEGSFQLPEDEG